MNDIPRRQADDAPREHSCSQFDQALAGARAGLETARGAAHEALAMLTERTDLSDADRTGYAAAHIAGSLASLNSADTCVGAAHVAGFLGPPPAGLTPVPRRTLAPRAVRLAALFAEVRSHVLRGAGRDQLAVALVFAEHTAQGLAGGRAGSLSLAGSLATLAGALTTRAMLARANGAELLDSQTGASSFTVEVRYWFRDARDYSRTAAKVLREAHRAVRAAEKLAAAPKAPNTTGAP